MNNCGNLYYWHGTFIQDFTYSNSQPKDQIELNYLNIFLAFQCRDRLLCVGICRSQALIQNANWILFSLLAIRFAVSMKRTNQIVLV